MDRSKLSIFISHSHTDRKIADVLKSAIDNWSNKEIDITQTSDPEHGLKVGEGLVEQLKNALKNTNVVILIYTFDDKDWSKVMYEAGVASGSKDTKRNKLIVLQCSDDIPPLFFDNIRIRIDEDGIHKFVNDFHTDPTFFPPEDEPYAPNLDQVSIKERSDNLFAELKKVVTFKPMEERRRWDMLCISLDLENVGNIFSNAEQNGIDVCMEFASNEILQNAVIKYKFGETQKHFDYATIDVGIPFNALINRWEQWNMRECDSQYSTSWKGSILKEMVRAITKRDAVPAWSLFKSARSNVDWSFIPVVNHTRIIHTENRMEFDLYFYRVSLKDGQVVLADSVQETTHV